MSLTEQHKVFAECMRICIKRTYDGKIPSYAKIARDFSLRSNQDAVSNESIRKWMTGKSLPQAQRLSALINWLGSEIADSLSLHSSVMKAQENSQNSAQKEINASFYFDSSEIENDQYVLKLIQNLSCRDRRVMISILRTLQKTKDQYEK